MENDLHGFKSGGLKAEASLLQTMEHLSHQDNDQISFVESAMQGSQTDRLDEISDRKDKLRVALAGFIVDNIRCRLNRVYLRAMASQGSSADHVTTSCHNDDLEASLNAELESLCDEITPVADMFIEFEYVAPIVVAAAERTFQLETATNTMLSKVRSLSSVDTSAYHGRL